MTNRTEKEKADIRERSLAARRALSEPEVADRSRAICSRLANLPEVQGAAAILTYVASKDNEVETAPFIGELLDTRRLVLVPVMEKQRRLSWSRLLGLAELERGPFGIWEPTLAFRRIVEPPEEALVFVPGIAFTRQGERIGYGGGYFDRFLATFGGLKIGLAYESQLVDAIPEESHDVPLDIVVTESGVYRRDLDRRLLA